MIRNVLVLVLLCTGALSGCSDDEAGETVEADAAGLNIDIDGDGVPNGEDNCPETYNPPPDGSTTQVDDNDGDGIGDVCDPDDDNDGVLDEADGCPTIEDINRLDTDNDGIGDACDDDADNDGVPNDEDACPLDPNFSVGDLDGDGDGDACDLDRDGDRISNERDNCPDAGNSDQSDRDGDGIGDVCDDDVDGDEVLNQDDNCRSVANVDQADMDEDDIGDECDMDVDGDGSDNVVDNCPTIKNESQVDSDQDGVGDKCDVCPNDALDDEDEDGICGSVDNCPRVANPPEMNDDGDMVQLDTDADGIGDVCDSCPADLTGDADGDGWCASEDNCPNTENPFQVNIDGDGKGDACDPCPLDPNDDQDEDGICGDVDNCPMASNAPLEDGDPQTDTDGDGLGDVCDPCPEAATNDTDGDGVCDNVDNCPTVSNPYPPGRMRQDDRDGDGLGDACDLCTQGGNSDPDRDGICNEADNCPTIRNANQLDGDLDGLGDVCDLCPMDADNDADDDRVCGDVDVCPNLPDPAQDDSDNDGIGDRCDDDLDGDDVPDVDDNCPFDANPDQLNSNSSPPGDACENLFFYEDFEAAPAGCENDDCEESKCQAVPAGWELSGRWLRTCGAAHRGQRGLIEGDNRGQRVVAINTPPIDLSRAERPKLSFWVNRSANSTLAFYVDVFVDRNVNRTFRIGSGTSGAQKVEGAWEYYVFDLREFQGQDLVRVRWRIDAGNGGQSRIYFDDVILDESPRPESLGIPWSEEFDTLEDWRRDEGTWTLGGPAWTPDFAAVMPSGYQPGDTAMLEMKYSLDLRQSVEPEITVWTRTSQPFASQLELGPLRALVEGIPGFEDAVNQNLQNLRRRFGDQRINLIIEGTDRSMVKQIYSGLGNALFERKSWPLTDFIDDPDVRVSFEYELGDGPFPAVYVDSVSVAEKPADQLSLTTPRVLDFPNDYTQLVTEGWDVVVGADGVARLGTTMRALPLGSYAKVRLGPFDMTGCAEPLVDPILRVWLKYDVALEQDIRLKLEPSDGGPRNRTLVKDDDVGESDGSVLFDVELDEFVGDLGLNLLFVIKTTGPGRGAGAEIERVEVVNGRNVNPINSTFSSDFNEQGNEQPVLAIDGCLDLDRDGFEDKRRDWLPTRGYWKTVEGPGRNGSGALMTTSGPDGASGEAVAAIEIEKYVDLRAMQRPRATFWIDFAEAGPNQSIFFVVEEDEDQRERIELVSMGGRDIASQGFQPFIVDLTRYGGKKDLVLSFEVDNPDGVPYAVVIDDFGLAETPDNPDSMLNIATSRPYTAFFNGEQLGVGDDPGVGERFLIRPKIGKNYLGVVMDSRQNEDFVGIALEHGRQFYRSGDAGWTVFDAVADDWLNPGNSSEILISNFEDQTPFVAEDVEDQGDAWIVTGTAFGAQPDSRVGRTVRVHNLDIDGHQGSSLVSSYHNHNNAKGSLFSPPFELSKPYLHFLIGGQSAPDVEADNCVCVRVWALNAAGERITKLATFTGNGPDRLEWATWHWAAEDAIPEALGTMVQIEIADENSGKRIHADDFYLSDNAVPHGRFRTPTFHSVVGSTNATRLPFFGTRSGAREARSNEASLHFYRYEFTIADTDDDGIPDDYDLCPSLPGPHTDTNRNGVGDQCDPCPDCENVARDGVAFADSVRSANGTFAAKYVIDEQIFETPRSARGDEATYWNSNRGSQDATWVQVELEGRHDVCVIRVLNTNHGGTYSYYTKAWRLYISEGDPDNDGLLEEVDSGDFGSLPPMTWHTTVLDPCLPANFVRFEAIEAGGKAGLNELEVYGRPLD